MYEAQTYEAILARMLQKALSINSNLDTREGSLVSRLLLMERAF